MSAGGRPTASVAYAPSGLCADCDLIAWLGALSRIPRSVGDEPNFHSQENKGGVMNKKFFIAWVAIFVAWMAGSFVVHGMLLHDDYAKLSGLFRPEAEAQPYFPLMVLAHSILAGAFVWIYSRGVEAAPWL